MTYLDPPPQPAPVIVVKDVGGIVRDYEAQTALYRDTDREVRLHECRSACTLALSLPNVCVYPDSVLKFHQAYNLRTRVTDEGVSQELFDSYPAAVRARLGTLTRDYRVLSGAELIKLGIRDCNTPRPSAPPVIVAAKPANGLSLSGLVHGVMASLGGAASAGAHATTVSAPAADTPLRTTALPEPTPADDNRMAAAPLPPRRPLRLTVAYEKPLPVLVLPRIITGAQPILPTGFSAYANPDR